MSIQKIAPCLWFDMNAEEAINYYVSTFKDARIVSINRYPDESLNSHFEGMKGKVINAEFELQGQRFVALDGGPLFKFNEAISFMVRCEDQAEIDYFWERLSHTPEAEQCGWCKDKFGVSWQIVPANMDELIGRSPAAMQAMMHMKKIVIDDLKNA